MKKYLLLLNKNIKSQLEYNKSMYLLIIGEFIAQFTFILSFLILFKSLGNVKGYTVNQAIFIYATVNICYTLAEMLGKGINDLAKLVRNGTLDIYFIRPMSILLQVMGNDFEVSWIGRLVQSLLIFGITLFTSNIKWNLIKISDVVLIIIAGIALFLSIYLFFGTLSFFTTKQVSISVLLMGSGSDILHYPANALPRGIRFILLYILPFGCINYLPFKYILGFTNNWLYCLTPCICFIFFGLVLLFWRYALSEYSSTGS
ncbi:ABC transporter permease [Ligilactobacillus cholophilus]|uniref:ABC transporter permease n=1 Tax=Ligilactobacillus cholophilus TaxID=3050131 RepID=UPI0025B0A36F|nr:ABC-2 family transporter protein [Ligilactobacillus cholophilus]